MVKFLLKKFEEKNPSEISKLINSINVEGDSLIRIAINNSNFVIAKIFVNYGADLNIEYQENKSIIINGKSLK